MWNYKKQRNETVADNDIEDPQHWPTERMIMGGHSDYATEEDLRALDVSLLWDIAKICDVPDLAPEECIPCMAYTKVIEAQKAAEEAEETPEEPEERETPALDDLMSEENAFTEPEVKPSASDEPARAMTDVPVAERFASHVRVLALLVDELLEGPPIPPPNVSEDELALLVVAAQKWIRLMEAQGLELGGPQQAVLDATKALVARLHHG